MTENRNTVCTVHGSSRLLLDQIADKWSVLILSLLCGNPLRFNEIKRRIDGITQKALAEALRRLERNGMVLRRVIPISPVAVEYSVTPLGHTLKEPFGALCTWALEHEHEVEQARRSFDQRATGSAPQLAGERAMKAVAD
ncbi:winged helix-turn-helix transcriptional regulator [Phyllobacterium myrsinacearum]|uniref:Transcriptional regulator n=1 Tax=Phyllobacterium myrsinacearum TaxID=28101 RepID=A0A2S9JFX5_9HYPH|nr:helix-turn-helix domain-containing protein [Phyllobacterium myrsinacearum]PRD51806.1 transcriptional regulator [Phyllobacterium myrsinacearum]PWV83653.1 HxlR family transcriptional regulator [Phyllobacterium myrsinacearum]RZV00103.1 HxlR family transcriptional regulator [Phyllobacterium myrsinacearum]